MSLNLRIILSATLVLIIFITLTAAALDRAFVESTETALRDRLTTQLYALMAAAEVNETGRLLMPGDELDALLGLPSSGLYAHITGSDGTVLWQSSSTLGAKPPAPVTLPGGAKRFTRSDRGEAGYYSFAYGVNWAAGGEDRALTFNITTDLASFNRQIMRYRTSLWGWLLAMAALLLISQALILRWGLSPLRRVSAELNRIESGRQDKIEETYPREIERLTGNINILLQQEREQKTRYRNALGDLAHSLKTPLAVLQSALQGKQTESAHTAGEQIARMNSIVEYQLQRAATAGTSSLGQSVPVAPLARRIVDALQKVYREKGVQVDISIDDALAFHGDEGDLMELLGNILDNAFKWCRNRIALSATRSGNRLGIRVSDDGPGIEPGKASQLFQRGMRADQATAGHGIGLSIVRSIVEAYKGEIDIEPNEPQGCNIRLTL